MPRNAFFRRHAHKVPLALAAAYVAILNLIFVFKAWPGGDDLNRSSRAHMRGVLTAVGREYLSWSGRWFGILLSYLAGWIFDMTRWYPILLLSAMAVVLVSVHRLAGTLSEGRLTFGQRLGVALMFYTVFWAGMPWPAEGPYNFTLAIENSVGPALATLLVAAQVEFGRRAHSKAWRIAFCLAAFCLVAMHEFFGTVLLIVLFLGAVQSWRLNRGDAVSWILSAGGAALGLLVVIGAPGNYRRAEMLARSLPGTADPARTVHLVIDQISKIPADWLLDGRLVSGLLLLATAVPMKGRPQWPTWRRAYWLPVVWVTVLGSLVFGFVLTAWLLGVKAPPRTLNGMYFIFLIGCLATGFLLSSVVSERGWSTERIAFPVRLAASLLFLTSIGLPWNGYEAAPPGAVAPPLVAPGLAGFTGVSEFFSSNASRAIEDLRFRAKDYSLAVHRRYQYLRDEAPRNEILVLEPLPTCPYLVKPLEVSPNPSNSFNKALATLFGVRSLRCPDPQQGEYYLGNGWLGRLETLEAGADNSNGSRKFFRNDLWKFRLLPSTRPPPTRVALNIIHRPSPSARIEALQARAAISGDYLETPQVEVQIEERSGSEGETLRTTVFTVGERDKWTPIEVTAVGLGTAESFVFSASMIEGAPCLLFFDHIQVVDR